jgi:hypothetical protein
MIIPPLISQRQTHDFAPHHDDRPQSAAMPRPRREMLRDGAVAAFSAA